MHPTGRPQEGGHQRRITSTAIQSSQLQGCSKTDCLRPAKQNIRNIDVTIPRKVWPVQASGVHSTHKQSNCMTLVTDENYVEQSPTIGSSLDQSSSKSARRKVTKKKKTLYLTAEQQEDVLLNTNESQKMAILRVEQVGNKEGKVLEIIFWFMMMCFVVYGIVSIVLSATLSPSRTSLGIPSGYYIGNLAALSTMLGLLVFMICFFGYRMMNVWRYKSLYKMRQSFMLTDARVIGSLTLVDLATVVTSYSLFVDASCIPNRVAISILSLIRAFVFLGVLAWMTVTARLMRVYDASSTKKNKRTGLLGGSWWKKASTVDDHKDDDKNTKAKDAIDISPPLSSTVGQQDRRCDPDRILLIDQPIRVILKDQIVAVVIYAVFIIVLLVSIVLKVLSGKRNPGPSPYPPNDLSQCPSEFRFNCSTTTEDIIEYAVTSTAIILYTCFYFVGVKRSWGTQKNLPSSHFRLSKLFLRIQMRYGMLLYFSIFFTGVITDLATIGTCQGSVNASVGSPGSHLALGIYACTILLLYAPAQVNDSYNRMIFKSIAWTEEDISAKKKERNDMIEAMAEQQSVLGKISPAKFFAKQIGVPDALGLFEKPMSSVFCMEYVCKLFLWTRAAYRGIEKGIPEYVPEDQQDLYPYSKSAILSTFGMDKFEYFFEAKTDTYAIMGWGNKTLVLSFRGTASNANVLTDLKAWSTRYPPHPHLTSGDTFGDVKVGKSDAMLTNVGSKMFQLPIRVHKGFYEAWTAGDFNKNVINAAVKAVDQMGNDSDIKIFITGHSLGGALACLASVELKIALPLQNVTVYTFGAPRVGNTAFGTYANILIPDYWHIVGTEDPVARIPKGSYKRSGHRALLGANGNMEIYPSHFEASLFTSVGGKVSDHLLKNYGTRLGQFLKAQFMPSISIGGAAEGVERLSEKIHLEKMTLVGPLEGDALYDQNLAVAPIEFAEAPKIKSTNKTKDNNSQCDCTGCLGRKSTNDSVDIEQGNPSEDGIDGYDGEYGDDGYMNVPDSLSDQMMKLVKNVME